MPKINALVEGEESDSVEFTDNQLYFQCLISEIGTDIASDDFDEDNDETEVLVVNVSEVDGGSLLSAVFNTQTTLLSLSVEGEIVDDHVAWLEQSN